MLVTYNISHIINTHFIAVIFGFDFFGVTQAYDIHQVLNTIEAKKLKGTVYSWISVFKVLDLINPIYI